MGILITPKFQSAFVFLKNSPFLKDIATNFLGGLFLVVFLFLLREILRSGANLSGEWEVENTVMDSSYNPYPGIRVVWRLHILQNGDSLSGSGEKIKEIRLDQTEFEYEPKDRDSVGLTGYIEKSYILKDRVFITSIQDGKLRKTRATYTLKRDNDNALIGTFITTAADSRGSSIFLRNK